MSRYAHVISSYPDSEYAAASQFKKAICYEKMENFDAACEEYVKLTYVYPESGFVADATLRLGNYYYKKEKYQVAAKIFFNFKQKNPTHKMAAQALFLAAQCAMKQKAYTQAAKLFASLVDEYQDDKALRAEAMYWMGDSYFKAGDRQERLSRFQAADVGLSRLRLGQVRPRPPGGRGLHPHGRGTEQVIAATERHSVPDTGRTRRVRTTGS